MKMLSFILALSISLFSANIFASKSRTNSDPDMCVYAFLGTPIRDGNVIFYDENRTIGRTYIYGRWLDVVDVYVGNYFKDQDEFEKRKKFLSVENDGKKVDVSQFTYEECI